MTFTDADLKRLKKSDHYTTQFQIDKQSDRWVSLKSLIARLEAAEWGMAELERQERKGYLHSDLVAPLEAWRKAAGKEE